jgi:hypothetical protein
MAKYIRYRKYTRRHRRDWSTRLQNFSGSQLATAGSDYVIYYNLCTNPAQSSDSVSNKYTVKNIKCELVVQSNKENQSSARLYLDNFQGYIMFVPQGYIPTGVPSAYQTLPFDHPEWIMAYRYFGTPVSDGFEYYPPLRLSSRLSRKLDTGDRVVLILLGQNSHSTNTATIEYTGLVKYNTKAN